MPRDKDAAHEAATAQAFAAITDWGYPCKRLTAYHLKIGRVNYWPIRGKMSIDGVEERYPHSGLAALRALLGKTYPRRHADPQPESSVIFLSPTLEGK